jgi:hypothetical protein
MLQEKAAESCRAFLACQSANLYKLSKVNKTRFLNKIAEWLGEYCGSRILLFRGALSMKLK